MAKILMKGNEALAEAAVRAGCLAYFGYPITPQTEVLEYMSRRMIELGRVFVQAESELGAINMLYGAACTGLRAMTTTSSPGFSLMQEGISYIIGSEVPAVIVNVMRGGPGLGNIQPAQGDYFQMTKGGGHGDYHLIVLAPSTIQELVDHTVLAFDLADKYRWVVAVIADGMLGQMMEPVELPPMHDPDTTPKPWALGGACGREKNVITSLVIKKVPPEKKFEKHIVTSLYLGAQNLESVNIRLQQRLREIIANEQRWECYKTEDAELLLVAYGTMARICKTAIAMARREGLRVGLFRPISVFPFPYDALAETAQGKKILTVEMSAGQMIEDVHLAVQGKVPVHFYGRMGGVVPLPEDVLEAIKGVMQPAEA